MPVERLRDVGRVVLGTDDLGCVQSATITLDSEILRARCGAAISERYQGITGLTVEAVIEALDPFIVGLHPGSTGSLSIFIPGTLTTTGVPEDGVDIFIVAGTLVSKAMRFERNSLATATWTIRGFSPVGDCPIAIFDAAIPDPATGAGPSDFIRDIGDFTFSGGSGTILADDFCPESFEATEGSELIEDSCQGELWPSYVGITGLNVTATAVGKGVKDAFEKAGTVDSCLGSKGELSFDVFVGSDDDCASLVPGGELCIERANITSLTITATHGQIATISLTWTAHGEAGEIGDVSKRAIVGVGSEC